MDGRHPPPFGHGLPLRPPLLVRDRSPLRDAANHEDRLPRVRRSRFDDPLSSHILPTPDPYRAPQVRRGLLETPGMAPSAMPTLVTHPDVEVIMVDNKQRLYAESVKGRLSERSIVAQIRLVAPRADGSVASAVQDAGRRRLKFACSINEMNALHHSITVHILQGVPQEHRNMPLDDAVELIVSTSDSMKKPVVDGTSSSISRKPVFTPPNENLKYLLNLAIDKKFLAIEEMDEVIEYFEQRRAELAKAQGVKPRQGAVKQPLLPKPPSPTPEPELPDGAKVMEDEQKKLQEKIFKLLKGEPIDDDDDSFDLPIASLTAAIEEGGTSSDDGTFQQVLAAIASNPFLKSLAGATPKGVAAPRPPTAPLQQPPAMVPPVYRAHVPGGLTAYGPPEPFNGRGRALLRAPGPPPLWPGY